MEHGSRLVPRTGDTSADAAGLPILPGLVRPDEVLDQGAIDHALRFTVPATDDSYVFPASHEAGSNNPSLPRMGEHFRLKASFDIAGFSPANQVILQALKTYGMIVADNGSAWYISGEPSSSWSDDELHALTALVGSNFEAVDLTPRLASLDQSSGSTAGGTAVTIHGQNFSGAAGQLQVFFGATAAAQVTIVSDTVLVATSPAHAAGTVDLTVHTPYGASTTSTADHFTFTAASPPVVDLNGGSAGSGFTSSWFNSGPVPITAMANATIAASAANLASLTVTLSSFHPGDVLAAPNAGGVTGLAVNYTAGTLSITGSQTVANYQKELRLVNYDNTLGGPGTATLAASIVASDGAQSSSPVTATINATVLSGQVLGERLFYNHSKYDGNNSAVNGPGDDLAIASDKIGFDGAGTATFANVSSFSRGITGVMIDLAAGLGSHAAISAASGDLTFKVSPATYVAGSYNNVAAWNAAPPPLAVSVRLGAGTAGSDRIEITWADGAIKNEWLEIDVHAGGNTGLSAADVVYFGSALGDSGLGNTASTAATNASDVTEVRGSITSPIQVAPVWTITDFDKSGIVNASDATIASNNFGFTLHYIANPSGPFAPQGAEASVAAAVVPAARAPVSSSAAQAIPIRQSVAPAAAPQPPVPPWLVARLAWAAAGGRLKAAIEQALTEWDLDSQ